MFRTLVVTSSGGVGDRCEHQLLGVGVESAEVVGEVDEYLAAPERGRDAQESLFSTGQDAEVIWDAGEVGSRFRAGPS